MPTDYVMNRIVPGATVKTTENYESECNRMFGKCDSIESAVVTKFIKYDTQVVEVKYANGKTRMINAFWLELV